MSSAELFRIFIDFVFVGTGDSDVAQDVDVFVTGTGDADDQFDRFAAPVGALREGHDDEARFLDFAVFLFNAVGDGDGVADGRVEDFFLSSMAWV